MGKITGVLKARPTILLRPMRAWPWPLAVLLLAALLFFARLGERSFWGPEGRWAEVAREMRASGNYFWPTINGEAYFGKPLLSYWLIAAAGSLTGGLDEFSARVPSAILGLFGVALVIVLARRLYDPYTAVLSGIILTTSYSYAFFARLAASDMATVTGVLGALTLFVYKQTRQNTWWIVGLWSIMAATSLTKGLVGFALPLLVIGVYSVLGEGWGAFFRGIAQSTLEKKRAWLCAHCRWFFNGKTPLAVMVGLLVYCLPFIISVAVMHSDLGLSKVWRENVVQFFAPFDHQGPVYLYGYAIFALMAPWSVFLPAALVQSYCRSQDKSDRFTLAYFWVTFFLFTIPGSRRDYYLLPILPGAAIMVARLLTRPKKELKEVALLLINWGYIMLAVFAVIAGVAAFLPPSLRPGALRNLPVIPEREIFVAFWLLMLGSVAYAVRELRSERIAFSGCCMAYLAFLYFYVFAIPGVEHYPGDKAFAGEVRAQVEGDLRRLVLFKIWDPALLFYLGARDPIPVYQEGTAVARLVEKSPDLWVIAQDSDLTDLRMRGSVSAKSMAFDLRTAPDWYTKYVLFRPEPSPLGEK